ncbi:hypothetical protein [Fictibacillus gelatini]|nr:hypothetical protein [Fictibacillus gelatini]
MKIKEILELTQSKKLAEIAKEHLEFGEKKAKEALKQKIHTLFYFIF